MFHKCSLVDLFLIEHYAEQTKTLCVRHREDDLALIEINDHFLVSKGEAQASIELCLTDLDDKLSERIVKEAALQVKRILLRHLARKWDWAAEKVPLR